MSDLRKYGVFISHAWKYSSGYGRVVRMLNEAPRFYWKNYSVTEHNPKDGGSNAALRQQLTNQIRPTHIVLILAGMYVNHREWIQAEIEIAQDLGKPIVGIIPRGNERTPTAVRDASKEMVGWSTNSVVSAIRRHSLK